MTAFSAAAHDEGGDTTKALRARITELEDMLANLPLSAPQRLRARIQQLEKMLAAVGAGGVGPLIPTTVQHQGESSGDNELQRKTGDLITTAAPPQSGGIPPNWKMVPVEPTIRQMAAMGPAIRACYDMDGVSGNVVDVYRAMLAAAPQPPKHYDQQVLDLCLTCGWKTMIPGDCCLNCARQKPQVEQEPVETFDEVWDAIDWGKWRMEPIRELVREIRSKTSPQPKRQPLTVEAKAVIDAARAAMDESTQSYNDRGDISIASELADALSLRLDEYDRAIEAAHGIGGEA